MTTLLKINVFCNRNNEEAGLPGSATRRVSFQLPRPSGEKDANLAAFVDLPNAGVSIEFGGVTAQVAAKFGGGKSYVVTISEGDD